LSDKVVWNIFAFENSKLVPEKEIAFVDNSGPSRSIEKAFYNSKYLFCLFAFPFWLQLGLRSGHILDVADELFAIKELSSRLGAQRLLDIDLDHRECVLRKEMTNVGKSRTSSRDQEATGENHAVFHEKLVSR
jgi:hypothetical protein